MVATEEMKLWLFRGICVDFRAFEAGRGAVLGAVKPPGGIKIAGFPAGAG